MFYTLADETDLSYVTEPGGMQEQHCKYSNPESIWVGAVSRDQLISNPELR